MPDDRMLHRCQGHSAKLTQCDHLAYRVWNQYLLSADDFGVMVDEAAKIRGDNLALMRETEAEIRRCLDLLLSLGLITGFEHQGQRYICSLKWQDYQKIAYPRTSYLPDPSSEVFDKLSSKTRLLFKKKKKAKEGDGHRLTANGKRLKARSKEESDGRLTPDALVELWNTTVGATDLPKVAELGGARRSAALARLKEHPDAAWWTAYFGRVLQSDFLCGRLPRSAEHANWRPSFDWALKPANLDKVQGGNYDNRKANTPVDARQAARKAAEEAFIARGKAVES